MEHWLFENEAVKKIGNYLQLVIAGEMAYDLADRLARARSIDRVIEVLRAALRLRDKILKRVEENVPEDKKQWLHSWANLQEESVQKFAQLLQDRDEKELRLATHYLASLALAYNPEIKTFFRSEKCL